MAGGLKTKTLSESTQNEGRKEIGYPPVEGGDEFIETPESASSISWPNFPSETRQSASYEAEDMRQEIVAQLLKELVGING